MNKQSDITISLPLEYFDALSEVIHVGLQRTKLDPIVRSELKAWWDAEKEIAKEQIDE